MKVVVLGYDALGSAFVSKKYSNLLQKYHGKVTISSDYPEVSTAPIWTSILTGKLPREHGIRFNSVCDSDILRWLNRKGLLPEAVKARANKHCYAENELMKRKLWTFLDAVQPNVAVNVPMYQKKVDLLTWFWVSAQAMLQPRTLTDDTEELKQLFLEVQQTLFKVIEHRFVSAIMTEGWECAMVYFEYFDRLAHSYIGDPQVMSLACETLDKFTCKVKRVVKDDTAIIVLSDHSMKPVAEGSRYGVHESEAFYSCNFPLFKQKTVYPHNFYDIILGLVNQA